MKSFHRGKLCHHCYREFEFFTVQDFHVISNFQKEQKETFKVFPSFLKLEKFSTRKTPRGLVYDMTLT